MTTNLVIGVHAIVYTAQKQPDGCRDRNRGPCAIAMIVSGLGMTPTHEIRARVGSSMYIKLLITYTLSFLWSDRFK